MSWWLLVWRSLFHYRRSHWGAALGMLTATAILTGALLMGDSVDHTLRSIALARLGAVHYALYTPNHFFQEPLASAVETELDGNVAGALQIRGMALHSPSGSGRENQINQVQVWGITNDFWYLIQAESISLRDNEVVLNEKLATALQISEGEYVSLRLVRPSLMPLDAPLSPRDEERMIRAIFTVRKILPDHGPGRFGLLPNQVAPYNAFIPLQWLQESVKLDPWVNVMVVGEGSTASHVNAAIERVWHPEHSGLRFREIDENHVQLESDGIYIEEPAARAALSIPAAQGTLAYLVNRISHEGNSTPYSFAVGGAEGELLHDNDALINTWLAEQLEVREGDGIQVAYFEVTPSNEFVERVREFRIHRILSMDDAMEEGKRMPGFPGLSDVESCQDWDIGMPMDEEALKDAANEQYWNTYRQAPKLWVSLPAAQDMWGNRFGRYTAIRFPGGAGRIDRLNNELRSNIAPADLGLSVLPVREQAMKAVDHALDFGALFLGMSFFLIISSLLLAGLLFVFGLQQRAGEMGVLLTMGYLPRHLFALLLAEAGTVALLSAVGGAVAGAYYARLLLFGLNYFWRDALAGALIVYHAQPATVCIGGLAGLGCAVTAMAWSSWRQTRQAVSGLLSQDLSLSEDNERKARIQWRLYMAIALILVLTATGWSGYVLSSKFINPALHFFGIGSLLLAAGMVFFKGLLLFLANRSSRRRMTLPGLAIRQTTRRPGRSLAAAGLLASGLFMALSVAAMHEDLFSHAHERWSGTGGFTLFAESTAPLLEKPALATNQDLNFVVGMRVRDGEDASCLNLNRAAAPRIYGVNPKVMAAIQAFDKQDAVESIWNLLAMPQSDGAIPALVGDADTALWGLQVQTHPVNGDKLEYQDGYGNTVPVRLVGNLPMRLSLFQGSILISEEQFTRLYPSENGYRGFLIQTSPDTMEMEMADLQKKYERFGMDVVPAVRRLSEFYRVESTYLAMFLVLGGLGVTLGAIGMGVIMLRNLLERRGEMAMLLCLGYAPATLLALLFMEHIFLLLAGVGLGGVASGVAMIPALFISDAKISYGVQGAVVCIVLASGMASMTTAILMTRTGRILEALRNE